MPFEEVIEWERFSLRLGLRDVRSLGAILRNVSHARIVEMCTAMREVWPRLLWTSTFPQRREGPSSTYLGEGAERDAFATFVQVLERRMPRYPEVVEGFG